MAKAKSVYWTTSPYNLAAMYTKLPQKIRAIAGRGLDTIAVQAQKSLKARTPGKRLPGGWKVHTRSSVRMYVKTIKNTDKRAFALIHLKDGRSTNLIEMLEYGTSPSAPIVPVKAKALRFEDPDTGEIVFTKLVNPRGIRPYAMVRLTHHEAARKIAKLQFVVSDKIMKLTKRR